MWNLSKRQFERDGLTVIVMHKCDDDADLSYLEQDYSDCPLEKQTKYKAQDAARLKAYRDGEWSMIGVVVEVRKQTTTKWANGGLEVGRASVWGVESDMDEAEITSIENDVIDEAFAEVDKLKAALLG